MNINLFGSLTAINDDDLDQFENGAAAINAACEDLSTALIAKLQAHHDALWWRRFIHYCRTGK